MTRDEEIILAERAQEILNNPAWQQLVQTWHDNLSEALADHCQDDVALKEIAHSYQAIRMLITGLEDFVATGRMAALQIEAAESKQH